MISERERVRRAAVLADGRHSARLAGGDVTSAFLADAQDYVNGLIDVDELLHRTQRRYGVEEKD
jgi:hypothetical protein